MFKILLISLFILFSLEANSLNFSNSITVKTKKESLSNNYDSWYSNSINYTLKDSSHLSFSLVKENLSRYNLDDRRLKTTIVIPILKDVLYQISYTSASNGIIIPKKTIYNKINFPLNSWLRTSLSQKNNDYSTGALSKIHSIDLITYYKGFRFAYGYTLSQVKDAGKSNSNKVSAHYFYYNHYTALVLSSGVELEALPNNSVLSLDVNSIALFGQFSFNKQWFLGYSFDYSKQGNLYTKRGVSVNALYKF